MSSTLEEIQEDIERTRAELRENVEALQEKASIKGAANRGAARVRDSAATVKDKVMGTTESGASAAKDTMSQTVGSAKESVGEVPDRVRRTTQGNPLAVGLGAFAVGWLVSSLIPATEKEQQAVQTLQNSDVVGPLQDSAQQVVSHAQEQGKQAVREVGDQAKAGAESVADSAKTTAEAAAEVVKDKADEVKQKVSS